MRTRTVTVLAGLATVVALVGCQRAHAGDGVHLSEFRISVPAGEWNRGRHMVEVTNDGQFPHTLVVSKANGEVVTATDLIPPGETVEIEVDADPGAYQLTCRIVTETDTGEIIDHFERGMHADIVVGGA